MRAAFAFLLGLCNILIGNAEDAFTFKAGIIAAGTDSRLYTRNSLSASFSWVLIPAKLRVKQIHVLQRGKILGIGVNNHLYMKHSILAPWRLLPNSCCVTEITTFKRGGVRYFLAIGTNKMLYMKASLREKWRPIQGRNLAVTLTGAGNMVIGVFKNNTVYIRRGLKGSACPLPRTSGKRDLFFNGVTLYGINNDHKIVQKRLPVLESRGKLWCKSLQKFKGPWKVHMNTCCVKSVSLAKPKIILRIVIIAVKKNKKLYFKSSLSSPWGHVANSGSVQSIAVVNSGLLVGVGTNNHLYTRESVDDAIWKLLPRSCCVKSITQLPDGRIIGVGMNNHLYKRSGLRGEWKLIPKSCCVTRITSINDRCIIGIGLNGALYQRKYLDSPWEGPIGNSLDVKLIDVKYSKKDDLLYGVTDKHKIVRKECNSIDSPWETIDCNDCCVISIAVK